jgi:AraC family transcriptional regulator
VEPTLITKDAFSVIGLELKTTTHGGKNLIEIPPFWEQVMAAGQIERIPDKKIPDTVLGICMDFAPDGWFSYLIAAEVTSTDNAPEGMVYRTIPAATYAVFPARGKMPASIQDTFKYIYREWLPNCTYRHAGSAEFEWYDERCDDTENAVVDIYIPVISH